MAHWPRLRGARARHGRRALACPKAYISICPAFDPLHTMSGSAGTGQSDERTSQAHDTPRTESSWAGTPDISYAAYMGTPEMDAPLLTNLASHTASSLPPLDTALAVAGGPVSAGQVLERGTDASTSALSATDPDSAASEPLLRPSGSRLQRTPAIYRSRAASGTSDSSSRSQSRLERARASPSEQPWPARSERTVSDPSQPGAGLGIELSDGAPVTRPRIQNDMVRTPSVQSASSATSPSVSQHTCAAHAKSPPHSPHANDALLGPSPSPSLPRSVPSSPVFETRTPQPDSHGQRARARTLTGESRHESPVSHSLPSSPLASRPPVLSPNMRADQVQTESVTDNGASSAPAVPADTPETMPRKGSPSLTRGASPTQPQHAGDAMQSRDGSARLWETLPRSADTLPRSFHAQPGAYPPAQADDAAAVPEELVPSLPVPEEQAHAVPTPAGLKPAVETVPKGMPVDAASRESPVDSVRNATLADTVSQASPAEPDAPAESLPSPGTSPVVQRSVVSPPSRTSSPVTKTSTMSPMARKMFIPRLPEHKAEEASPESDAPNKHRLPALDATALENYVPRSAVHADSMPSSPSSVYSPVQSSMSRSTVHVSDQRLNSRVSAASLSSEYSTFDSGSDYDDRGDAPTISPQAPTASSAASRRFSLSMSGLRTANTSQLSPREHFLEQASSNNQASVAFGETRPKLVERDEHGAAAELPATPQAPETGSDAVTASARAPSSHPIRSGSDATPSLASQVASPRESSLSLGTPSSLDTPMQDLNETFASALTNLGRDEPELSELDQVSVTYHEPPNMPRTTSTLESLLPPAAPAAGRPGADTGAPDSETSPSAAADTEPPRDRFLVYGYNTWWPASFDVTSNLNWDSTALAQRSDIFISATNDLLQRSTHLREWMEQMRLLQPKAPDTLTRQVMLEQARRLEAAMVATRPPTIHAPSSDTAPQLPLPENIPYPRLARTQGAPQPPRSPRSKNPASSLMGSFNWRAPRRRELLAPVSGMASSIATAATMASSTLTTPLTAASPIPPSSAEAASVRTPRTSRPSEMRSPVLPRRNPSAHLPPDPAPEQRVGLGIPGLRTPTVQTAAAAPAAAFVASSTAPPHRPPPRPPPRPVDPALARVLDALPDADEASARMYLTRCGGDDVRAISEYLYDHREETQRGMMARTPQTR